MKREYQELLKDWQEKLNNSQEDIDALMSNFKILFAYHSNSIENPQTTYHDTREVFENGKVCGFTGDLRTLYEIENQKIAFNEIIEYIKEKRAITPDLIKRLHKLLMRGCIDDKRYSNGERAGEYKKGDYITGDGIGSLPEDVPRDIEELCDEINSFEGDVLVAAAYLHLAFESIHPFSDGNGRVGRTLLNYYLLINDYPPVVIYNEDKQIYYMALAAYDKTERIDGFIEFIQEEAVKTWERKPKERTKLKSYQRHR